MKNICLEPLASQAVDENKKSIIINVTLEHKTSHKDQFCELEIYASSE